MLGLAVVLVALAGAAPAQFPQSPRACDGYGVVGLVASGAACVSLPPMAHAGLPQESRVDRAMVDPAGRDLRRRAAEVAAPVTARTRANP